MLERNHGFKDKSIEVIRAQYERDTTLVKQFLHDKCVLDFGNPSYYTLKPILIHEFVQYCENELKNTAPSVGRDYTWSGQGLWYEELCLHRYNVQRGI
jgi:hypothetical protein